MCSNLEFMQPLPLEALPSGKIVLTLKASVVHLMAEAMLIPVANVIAKEM